SGSGGGSRKQLRARRPGASRRSRRSSISPRASSAFTGAFFGALRGFVGGGFCLFRRRRNGLFPFRADEGNRRRIEGDDDAEFGDELTRATVLAAFAAAASLAL